MANILGSTLGTFLVGFVLMDYWSMQQPNRRTGASGSRTIPWAASGDTP